MERMQDAKLNKSAIIGEGSPSLVRVPIKKTMCVACLFIRCQKIFVFMGILLNKGPPSEINALLCGFAKRI